MTSTLGDIRIILILHGQFTPSNQSISDIYIYSLNEKSWLNPKRKINGIYRQLEDLLDNIKNLRIPTMKNPPWKSMENFFKVNYLSIVSMKSNPPKSTKTNSANLCKKLHENNPYQQMIINDFQNTYSSDQALRMQQTDLLFLFHCFILDM